MDKVELESNNYTAALYTQIQRNQIFGPKLTENHENGVLAEK